MADQAVGELIRAQSIGATDLFVLEQGGVAKSLTGQILLNWLTSAADGHGGIHSIDKLSTSGLADTYRITLADTTTFDFVVTNGRSINSIAKTSTSGLVDTYTITYNDGTTSTFTVTNGEKGDPGKNAYMWIKYASQEPTESSHSMGDVPDAWMGVYSGNAATAPTDWTQYKWYKIEGLQGDPGAPAALISSEVTYQVSDSGRIIPSGAWGSSIPVVPQGKYLWTKTELQFNSGDPIISYSVSRIGMDGLGSVSSVCNVSPDADGNVELSASDVGALPTTGGDLTGELRMNGQSISGLNEPTGGGQAAPKSYVDKRVPLDGSVPMTGNLPMGAHRITDLAEPEDGGDAATKGYTDDAIEKLLKKSGGIMTGEINMNGQPISGLNAPTEDTQAANKGYVDSKLKFGGVSMANSIVMEYSLGTSFTDEQSADIRSGKFEKVHVGGYWTINGRKYWAAHADYRLHCGDTELTTHHMLVIPDRSFYNGVMNDTDVTTGAYYGSKMRTSGLADALATVKADFGADHILTHRILLANAVSNRISSGWAWYDSQIDLMNEKMVYGSYAWGGGSQNGYDTGADKSQLALFQARPDLITNREKWWLRDVNSETAFCGVHGNGLDGTWDASSSIGVRPAFLIY